MSRYFLQMKHADNRSILCYFAKCYPYICFPKRWRSNLIQLQFCHLLWMGVKGWSPTLKEEHKLQVRYSKTKCSGKYVNFRRISE